MSSSISYETCHICGSPESLCVEFYTNQEEYHHCSRCGYHYERCIKRDDNQQPIYSEEKFNKEDCYLVQKEYFSDNVLWEKSLNDIENLTDELFKEWINDRYSFGDESDKGHRQLCVKNGNRMKRILFMFGFWNMQHNEDYIIIRNIQYDEDLKLGAGTIEIIETSGLIACFTMDPGTTKEEILKEMKEKYEEHLDTIEEIKGYWFNEKEKKIEVIKLDLEIEMDIDNEF